MDVGVRLIEEDDAEAYAAALVANRAFLTPWEPVREEAYFTSDHQRTVIADLRRVQAAGLVHPGVITVDGQFAGRINLSNVVRGPFCSAHLGYWVAERFNGRGVATAAVGLIVQYAFGLFGLHRVQAATLLHNVASQKVLGRHGFTEIGVAERYLNIAGLWQDHRLFQLVADD